jgi:hypothetical protein
MRTLGRELAPGRALLFLLVADADVPAVREQLGPYGGELAVSEVTEGATDE